MDCPFRSGMSPKTIPLDPKCPQGTLGPKQGALELKNSAQGHKETTKQSNDK